MECCSHEYEKTEKQPGALIPVTRGEEKCFPDRTWGAGVQACFAVHYILSGKGTFYCGSNRFSLQAGQIFVVFPDTVVKYTADHTDPWHYMWIAFQGTEGMSVLAHAGLTPLSPVMTPKDGDAIVRLLKMMPGECPLAVSERLLFTSQLYGFLSLLCQRTDREKKTDNVYFAAATVYIRSHYSEPVTVDGLAEYIGISRKYLYAIFKKHGGCSPKEYIVDYRMARACELLQNKSLSIGQVACSVGYTDILVFSKMFKKKTGVSPTEYRSLRE